MFIQHPGHAEFLIENENGVRIVTDPYDARKQYSRDPLHEDGKLLLQKHNGNKHGGNDRYVNDHFLRSAFRLKIIDHDV